MCTQREMFTKYPSFRPLNVNILKSIISRHLPVDHHNKSGNNMLFPLQERLDILDK